MVERTKRVTPLIQYLTAYDRQSADDHAETAQNDLLSALTGCSEQEWLECARALVLRSHTQTAEVILSNALVEHPDSVEIRLALAGIKQETNQLVQAECLLRELLAQRPDHIAAAFLLARVLQQQGKMHAVSVTLRMLFARVRQASATVIQAVELLDDCGRKQDAAAICEGEIAAGSTDPRIYAYAGMLEIQLGAFESARQHYLFALEHSTQALEWNIPIGLASLQRYRDDSHPDFQRLSNGLQQPELSTNARATILFALAKAHDDIANYERAVNYLQQANGLAHSATRWSRKHWQRGIEARVARHPPRHRIDPSSDWTPVFIVGVPRSGTTLVAELLSRHPQVCNRGEFPLLPILERQLAHTGGDIATFEHAAATYQRQLRQDDSSAQWFIDKQPLNLLRVDLIMALWPNARIIHCQRNPRDTALSLWAQYFIDDEQGYASDFHDIAAVIRGSDRLMTHWKTRYAASIYCMHYEHLTQAPATYIASLTAWLDLPSCDMSLTKNESTAISTASVWQARQPVYTRSVERWRHYAAYLPQLLKFPAQ